MLLSSTAQTISFDDPSSNYLCFNILEISEDTDSVQFNTIAVNTLL